jgi:hypothetical protein
MADDPDGDPPLVDPAEPVDPALPEAATEPEPVVPDPEVADPAVVVWVVLPDPFADAVPCVDDAPSAYETLPKAPALIVLVVSREPQPAATSTTAHVERSAMKVRPLDCRRRAKLPREPWSFRPCCKFKFSEPRIPFNAMYPPEIDDPTTVVTERNSTTPHAVNNVPRVKGPLPDLVSIAE